MTQVDRIRAAFPRIANAGNDILSLADYLDSRPERFFSRGAAEAMGDLLDGLRRDHPDILIDFFRTRHEALKTAFRSMEDINRIAIQDFTLGEISKEAPLQLATLDTIVHPAYLRLTEAVLGIAILPAARLQRRLRSKKELDIELHARLDEAAKSSLGPYLEPFQRSVRNAIAHAGLVFRADGVEYLDRDKDPVRYSIERVFHLFDRAVDVCNGFLLAYRLFFARAVDFLSAEQLVVPLPVLVRELQAQMDSPMWRIVSALDAASIDDRPALRLLADSRFSDDGDVWNAAIRTAAAAERLAPGFGVYEIAIDAFGMPKGIGVVKGETLRALREGGHTTVTQVADAFESLLIFPPIVEQSSTFVPQRFEAGKPFLRWTRLVRKVKEVDWVQVNAAFIMEMDDKEAAKSYVRSHVREMIDTTVEQARAACTDAELRSLRIGAVYLMIFLRDARQRDLGGIGTNVLAQIIERHVGPIADWPLYQSEIERIGRWSRIEWNTAPFGDD